MSVSPRQKSGTFVWSRLSPAAKKRWAALRPAFNHSSRKSREGLLHWLEGSALRDDGGKPLLLYHSAYGRGQEPFFRKFLPLSHFGSQKAALKANRWEKFGRLQWKHPREKKLHYVFYQVALSLKNPLPVHEDFGSHGTPEVWRDYFRHAKPRVLSREEISFVFAESGHVTDRAAKKEMSENPVFPAGMRSAENLWKHRMIRTLEEKGYDGIIYRNCCEDRQSLSYINFDSNQARIVSGISEQAQKDFRPYKSHSRDLPSLGRLNSRVRYDD